VTRAATRRLGAPGAGGARTWARLLATVLRFGLAALWLAAGILKIGDPAAMVRSVRAFRILPEALVHPVAYAVPFVEIALGLLLLAGLAARAAAVVSSVLLAAYIAAIASAAARGLRIECGCFSRGGDLAKGAPTHYSSELIRDSSLLVASLLLAALPAGYLLLERVLLGPGPRPPAGGAWTDDTWDDESWDDHAQDEDAQDEDAQDEDARRCETQGGEEGAGGRAGWGTGGTRAQRAAGNRTRPGDGAGRRRRDA
jgi:uncharacterized membrane protein YphA (DoxX/SURF4 family)